MFVINIDFVDESRGKSFSSKLYLIELAATEESLVDEGLLNSLQSKYLYLIGCLNPNAVDEK